MTFLDELILKFPDLAVLRREAMAKHTSFRIGGPADIIFPKSCEELIAVYRFLLSVGITPYILGAGTNILASDEGVSVPVISTRELNRMKDCGDGILEAECGVLMARFACFARDLSLTGLEFSHGIPGTIGGGVYMNAGAYGGEMKDVVIETEALLPDGTVCLVQGQEHGFSYRHSVFEEKSAVILKVRVKLAAADSKDIVEKMQELAKKRRESQPLEYPSAGSTFKRPADGYAAALIDEAGLKGYAVGDAEVSKKHAGFVVNLGSAAAADVKAVMDHVKNEVYKRSGIELEPEVRIW